MSQQVTKADAPKQAPTHWQDPDRPGLIVEHGWLYSRSQNDATSDFRSVYVVPGIIKRGKFHALNEADSQSAKAAFNPDWRADL